MDKPKGTYVLLLTLDKKTIITVGKLTTFSFPRGYYLYIGSALGGLFSRVNRHICGSDRLHWHIDYLRREAMVVEVWYLISQERLECSWFGSAMGIPQAQVPVTGFGSSGCRCLSHLVYFPAMLLFEDFRDKLGEGGENLVKMCV